MFMLIDAHHHLVIDKEICPYFEQYAEKIEEIAEKYNIDYLCIMGLGNEFSHFGGNNAVLKLADRCSKILPIAYVNLDSDTPEQISVFVDQGFRAFKCINPKLPYNSDVYIPLYEAIAKTGKYIHFHTGLQGSAGGHVDSSNVRPVLLDRICHLFPEMPVIMAHLGGMAWINEGLAMLNYHDNLFCDLTGGPASLDSKWYKSYACRSELNWDKVVFGTDSMIGDFGEPFDCYKEKIEFFNLSETDQDQVWGMRIAKLLML